ncbi:MAG: hypothetical protein LBG16_05020 [Elusimicrobiota bacterium]|jgi:lipopolysaccharide biosynthesis glycosyltransferase|nr:hypothetical protein [Elusimicrobiota bacterium]
MDGETQKNLVIVFACDEASSFALAVALMSLKKNSPSLCRGADIVVYTQDMRAQTKETLQNISKIDFRDFILPFSSGGIKTITLYTELTLARYKCFELLQSYKKVLWLDIDILISSEIADILSYDKSGIALAHDLNLVASNFFKAPPQEYDLTRQNFNAGVMLLTQNLPDPAAWADFCWRTTQSTAALLRWPDQAVLNIALQHFNVQPAVLPAAFNAHPFSAPVPCYKAALLHAMGRHKFWTDCPLPQWFWFYAQWLAMGGRPVMIQKRDAPARLIFKIKILLEKAPILWLVFNFFNKRRFKKLNKKVSNQVLRGHNGR